MESRYLYRGKRTDNGKWAEGYHAIIGGKPVIIEKEPEKYYDVDGGENRSGNKILKIVPDTICQCTAMPDKNKKLVFEHDIVWDSDERAFYEIIWNQEDMCWNVEDADGHKSKFEECYGSTIEVNGNRFDNPELLEV